MTDRSLHTLPILDARRCALAIISLGVLMSIVLAAMGRKWWCEAGDWAPWSWDIWTRHNSQHVIDPYSLSHLEHGIGLFVLLTVLGSRWLSVETRTIVVAGVEAIWEIAENTPLMIQRYRETTISLDYFGDSIINSIGDYAMCMIGVLVARKLPWRWAVALFFALEAISMLWIRDSLLLNILMLFCPIEAIYQWQAAGAPS